jgi:hypothetical protein
VEGEVLADVVEADRFEGVADSGGEVFDGDGGALVAVFEVDEEAAGDIRSEPPAVLVSGGAGGRLDGVDDPLFFVGGRFPGSDESSGCWAFRGWRRSMEWMASMNSPTSWNWR